MNDPFYRAFEDRFRGSREVIKGRLRAYLPFIEPIAALRPGARALDLGCGRGEWLEILGQARVSARGVDSDSEMLRGCRESGLKVEQADALQALRGLPDASEDIVSGFHLAEHLAFADLQELVRDAKRVLSPGGLLILESPNPENPSVGGASFYLDPTHVRPIPPALLAFLAEHHGFARVKVLRLQEHAELHDRPPTLLEVITGASPDYAVVAQKAGDAALLSALEAPFARDYGLSLEVLARRYDTRVEERFAAVQARADEACRALEATRASRSWRWTSPLRAAVGLLERWRGGR